MKRKIIRLIGLVGTVFYIYFYATHFSWPTPDKILVLMIFVFMMFGQGWQVFKRLLPFVVLLLTYESFRGLVPHLNKNVNYDFMIQADRFLFGGTLPTTILQNWIWDGYAKWFDIALYIVYMLHFILPFGLAILIWKTRERLYWHFVSSIVVVSFAGFLTFLAFPAAPPWYAAERGKIEPIARISSDVWWRLGFKDFPSVYKKISPNPVAAVPSLHAAYATILLAYVYKLYGRKWGALASTYPFLIYTGTVYQGEHYAIDEIIGAAYGVATIVVVHYFYKKRLNKKFMALEEKVSEKIDEALEPKKPTKTAKVTKTKKPAAKAKPASKTKTTKKTKSKP